MARVFVDVNDDWIDGLSPEDRRRIVQARKVQGNVTELNKPPPASWLGEWQRVSRLRDPDPKDDEICELKEQNAQLDLARQALEARVRKLEKTARHRPPKPAPATTSPPSQGPSGPSLGP